MLLHQINPFIRYANILPSLLNGDSYRKAYDYRLFYILGGSGTLILPDREIALKKSGLVFIPPETPYYTRHSMRVISLNFDLDHSQCHRTQALDPSPVAEFDPALVFENDPPAELSQVILLEEAAFLENRLNQLVVEFQFLDPCSELRISAILKEVLSEVLQARLQPKNKMTALVYRTIDYIKRNYQKQISNESVAQAAGYNALYLNRVFKAYTGLTIHAYVTRERINAAALLLHGTELPVELIAQTCGFPNSPRFSAAFRQATGHTPTEFRRQGLSVQNGQVIVDR